MSETLPATTTTAPAPALTVKNIFAGKEAQTRFGEMLGKKAQGFITSVLHIVSSNNKLREADPMTVYYAAATAATMDLPINQNLGFAWIVPYKGQAQFQMGYKGYIQLALRTAQYARINAALVYKNQFKAFNELTEELDADFSVEGEGEVVGYCSYFKLINGFEKTTYWSKAKVTKHARRFSQSFDYATSPWKSDFDSMALKTVLKNSLAKWGILSIEMHMALLADQAVVKNADLTEFQYIDNEPPAPVDLATNAAQATEKKLNKKTTAKETVDKLTLNLGGDPGEGQ